MVNQINIDKISGIDSIPKLAEFWETHDLTDFESELEEVTEKVFERKTEIKVPLSNDEVNAVVRLAKKHGVAPSDLIREWVIERVQPFS